MTGNVSGVRDKNPLEVDILKMPLPIKITKWYRYTEVNITVAIG